MKFLFVTIFGESLALMQTLEDEGHRVKCFVKDPQFQDVGRGVVSRVRKWKPYAKWADVIVFDDADLGKDCENMRSRGYPCVGGNSFGDNLENQRLFGQKILEEVGIKIPKSQRFKSFRSAINFVGKRPARYVLKFNGQLARYLSYVGRFSDGSDVVDILEHYLGIWNKNRKVDFIVQKYVDGIEMGVGAFFNGADFVYPINITFEHKHFLAGGVGPLTPEMGTSMYYSKDGGKLFRETLLKMKPYLARTNYRGFIDINCMVTERGAYALEFSSRFGYPQLDIQLALHKTPWGELLHKLALGTLEKFDAHRDFAVGVVIAGAGVPFEVSYNKYGRGLPILGINENNKHWIRLSEVFRKNGAYYCAGSGYPMTVTGRGKSMVSAQQAAYNIVDQIVVPNSLYRTDIGDHWKHERLKLKKWGYI